MSTDILDLVSSETAVPARGIRPGFYQARIVEWTRKEGSTGDDGIQRPAYLETKVLVDGWKLLPKCIYHNPDPSQPDKLTYAQICSGIFASYTGNPKLVASLDELVRTGLSLRVKVTYVERLSAKSGKRETFPDISFIAKSR